MKHPVKKKGQQYPNHPEDNRLVRCKCFDWSPYEVVGMFVPYKKPQKEKNYVGLSRFMIENEFGWWESAKETWLDCESWEYVESEV